MKMSRPGEATLSGQAPSEKAAEGQFGDFRDWQLNFSILSTFLVCYAYSLQKLYFLYWPVLLSFDPLHKRKWNVFSINVKGSMLCTVGWFATQKSLNQPVTVKIRAI